MALGVRLAFCAALQHPLPPPKAGIGGDMNARIYGTKTKR